jgi:hypothetical protein
MAMLNTVTDYNTRVALGKSRELEIIEFLRKKGYKIIEPTSSQDMHDKIDGFICPKMGGKLSFQLKQRESNQGDIIFEIIKDWDRNIEGRDLQSKADLYIVVDRYGHINIFNTKEIKDKARELLALADKNPNNQEGTHWELKFTQDFAHGQTKLMAFFNPNLFKIIASHTIPDYSG